MSDRYKDQIRLVKIYRWLRYKPVATLRAIYYITRFVTFERSQIPNPKVYNGLWTPTTREYSNHIWTCCMSMAEYKMKNYITLGEAIDEIKTK